MENPEDQISTEQDPVKLHIENLYQLFDPEKTKSEEQIIQFAKSPIQCLYVLLSFIINTRKLVELENITDKFVEQAISAFNQEDESLREKMIQLDQQIKACTFSNKKFKDCALFYNVWSEILETFMKYTKQEIEPLTDDLQQLNLDQSKDS